MLQRDASNNAVNFRLLKLGSFNLETGLEVTFEDNKTLWLFDSSLDETNPNGTNQLCGSHMTV